MSATKKRGRPKTDNPKIKPSVSVDREVWEQANATHDGPMSQLVEELLRNHIAGAGSISGTTEIMEAAPGDPAKKWDGKIREVSYAEQYASKAIRQLERITNDDPKALSELERVEKWIHDFSREKIIMPRKPKRKGHVPREGLEMARRAIASLNQISNQDAEVEQGFAKVIELCQQRLAQITRKNRRK